MLIAQAEALVSVMIDAVFPAVVFGRWVRERSRVRRLHAIYSLPQQRVARDLISRSSFAAQQLLLDRRQLR